MQLSVRSDDDLALPGVFATLLEQGGGGFEGGGDRVDRRGGIGRAGHRAHEELLQCARSPEQNLALVSEVPEERSLRQSCARGELRNGGVLEPALAEESEGCLLEPAAAVRPPTCHTPIVLDDDSG